MNLLVWMNINFLFTSVPGIGGVIISLILYESYYMIWSILYGSQNSSAPEIFFRHSFEWDAGENVLMKKFESNDKG